MKLVESSLRCAIVLLKFNLAFVLFLQTVKFLITADLSKWSTQSVRDSNSTQPSLGRFDSIKEFLSSLTTIYSYDVNQIEAVKTDLIDFHYENKTSNVTGDQMPFITISSHVNFTEAFQFNNLRNMVKLVLVLNLNVTLTLINVILVCYFCLSMERARKKRMRVMLINLAGNFVILVSVILLNSFLMLCMHRYYHHKGTMFTNLNQTLMRFFVKYFGSSYYGPESNLNNLVDLKDYYLVDSKIWMKKSYVGPRSMDASKDWLADAQKRLDDTVQSYFPSGTSGCDDSEDLIAYFLSRSMLSCFRLNLLFMFISTLLLLAYSFFIKPECEKSTTAVDEKKPIKSDWSSSSDEEEDDLSDNESQRYNEKASLLPPAAVEVFNEHKKRKLHKKLSFHVQCMIHSFFIIYLLGIWDIADVFQLMRMQDWDNTNMNLFLNKNSDYARFINDVNTFKPSMNNNSILASVKAAANSKAQSAELTVNMKNNYFNKFNNQFYQHSYAHQTSYELKKSLGRNEDRMRELKSTTKIKALFVIKVRAQLIADLVTVMFLCIILINLDIMENYLHKYLTAAQNRLILHQRVVEY